jgi:hypothetical protein
VRHSDRDSPPKRDGTGNAGPILSEYLQFLEHELATQFENAGIPRARDLTKLAGIEARVEVVELGVVEGVERFEPKFEVRPLCHRERFVERGGEVDAAAVRRSSPGLHYQSPGLVRPAKQVLVRRTGPC